MQRQIFPVRKSVASRVAHHRRGAGGTALLSQRRRLLNEAEEEFRHIPSLRFAFAFRARYPLALAGFNRAELTESQQERLRNEIREYSDDGAVRIDEYAYFLKFRLGED